MLFTFLGLKQIQKLSNQTAKTIKNSYTILISTANKM